ncbi:DNA primase TraC [Pseudomonas fluorescens]|nr:DNA primase TraC [Pseudomonas fluorescens]
MLWVMTAAIDRPVLVADESEAVTDHVQAAQSNQASAVDRTYVQIPFKEKEQARELDAKWDRQEKSWYIPADVDKEAFAHWLNPSPMVEAAKSEHERSEAPQIASKPQSSREYLAVPYGERSAAKAAGAAWDKTAKSWYIGPDGDTAALARWKPENVSNEQSPALDVREEFIGAMEAVGLIPGGKNNHPIMDGKKHRVPVVGGRTGATDGFYVAHSGKFRLATITG